MKSRLNSYYFESDLLDFLKEQSDLGVKGSYADVLLWKSTYARHIENSRDLVKSLFATLFPKAVIYIEPCVDDSITFFVKIYGIDPTPEDRDEAHKRTEEIGKTTFDDKYLLIPSFIGLKSLQEYYPQIHHQYLRKNTP